MARAAFDLAILGAGPAGAAGAARAADLGLSVLLCEPQSDGFDKPCGEGLMPAGAAVLRELGIARGTARTFAGLRYCVPGAGALTIGLDAPGESWWRTDLHAALAAALDARAGVVRVAARGVAAPATRGFVVRAGAHEHEARILVAADGAAGGGAPWLRPARSRRGPRRLGARQRFLEHGRLDRVEIHFGRGYDVYLTPLPRGAVNVVVLAEFRGDAAPDAGQLVAAGLAAHPEARACLGAAWGRAEARALGQPPPRRIAGGGAFLVGDAGGAVDPIVGAGVSIALRTGLLAAEAAAALRSGVPAREVERAFCRAGARERRTRSALAATLRWLSRHDAAARAALRSLRAAPRVAHALASIAAGKDVAPAAAPPWSTRVS